MADEKVFSSMELDAIGELMNISLGSSATAVSTLLDRRVNITTPTVSIKSKEEFEFAQMDPAMAVEITYVEGLDGNNIMLLHRDDVRKILEILMMTEIDPADFELDELSMSAICEVMNQMMGSSATTMSDLMGETVNISTPVAFEVDDKISFKDKYFGDNESMVIVTFTLDIENCLNSTFMTLMSIPLVEKMIRASGMYYEVDEMESGGAPATDAAPAPAAAPPEAAPAPDMGMGQQVPPMQDPYGGMPPQGYPPQGYPPQGYPMPMAGPQVINVQNMTGRFDNVTKLSKSEEGNLDLIMSVPLQISVEIGRTTKQVKEILALSQGSLIVLDKLAGEQVDVFVNGQQVAKGDVVVIEDNFGVRITEIIKNPEALLKKG
ncbi:MAG: flagellar motor switch phosphatase FliY [Clostridia bacterium]|nr:flagellar motor switch phosphatase FliY [Clostridia bacterium]